MNGAFRLFALLAVALAGLILVELTTPFGDDPQIAEAPESAPADSGAASQAGGSPAEFATAILARPLFRPGRQPYPDEARGPLSAPPPDLPRLAGILMSSDLRRAIFEAEGTDRSIVVVEGEAVGDWHVQEIAADSVTLVGPDGTRRLEPKFAAGPTAGPGQVAPQPQPAPVILPPGALPRQHSPANGRRQRNGGVTPPPQRKH